MSSAKINAKQPTSSKPSLTISILEEVPTEFIPREQLLRKVAYYEFPHTIVLSKGFQSGFTMHTILKHIIQDHGYEMKKVQHLINKSISGEEYFMSGGFYGVRTVEEKRRKGTSASKSDTKGITGTSKLAEKTTVEFWLSYIGSLHTYQVIKKIREEGKGISEIHYDGTGMQVKIMIAIDYKKLIAKEYASTDFDFFKKIIPSLASINLLSMDVQFSKEPYLRFVSGSMPWIDPPDAKIITPAITEKHKKEIEDRFPLKYEE